jgi:putative copper resistance protein D
MLENPMIVTVTGGELIILAAAMGAVACNLWVLPSEPRIEPPHLSNARSKLWQLLVLCLIGFTLGSAIELLLRTANMSDLPFVASFPEVGTVLFKTHYGLLWWWRCAALLIAWIAWALHRRENLYRILSMTVFIALAAIALTISASGHAGDDGILSVANIANSLHIIGAFLWGGGIIATAIIIFPILIRARTPARELIATASLRLSTLAGIALALVLIPGMYNAWLQIDNWHELWATLYGQLLVAKVALVAAMAALGALNRYRYVPAIQRDTGRPEPRTLFTLPRLLRGHNDSTAVMHFFRSLRVEMTLLLGVLLLAAALSQQTPASHAEHDTLQGHVHSDD